MVFVQRRRTAGRVDPVGRPRCLLHQPELVVPLAGMRRERVTMANGKEPSVDTRLISEPKGWRPVKNPIPRFLAKVQYLDNGCWQWMGAMHRHGYGAFGIGSDIQGYAHRWSYLFFVGNIPSGFVVDHLCRNPGCVNPDHLEPVPTRVNTMRGTLPEVTRARYRAQTHCRRGHPFDEQNTYRHPSGRRVCRACFRQYDRSWKRAKRAGLPTRRSKVEQGQPDVASQQRRGKPSGDVKKRFLGRIEIAASGCWNWTASRLPTGYGRFQVGHGGDRLAHRWAYVLFVAPIPAGTEIDHLCRNRACVNPEHLEPVTRQENCRRGDGGLATGRRNKAKTHCPHGHPYDDENTYRNPQAERACRTCQRLHARAYYRRRKSTGDQLP